MECAPSLFHCLCEMRKDRVYHCWHVSKKTRRGSQCKSVASIRNIEKNGVYWR